MGALQCFTGEKWEDDFEGQAVQLQLPAGAALHPANFSNANSKIVLRNLQQSQLERTKRYAFPDLPADLQRQPRSSTQHGQKGRTVLPSISLSSFAPEQLLQEVPWLEAHGRESTTTTLGDVSTKDRTLPRVRPNAGKGPAACQ